MNQPLPNSFWPVLNGESRTLWRLLLPALLWCLLLPLAGLRAQAVLYNPVGAGQSFAVVLRPDGTLLAWGYNGNGQLGNGTSTSRLLPASVAAPASAALGTAWTSVVVGWSHALARRSDNTLWGWGYNVDGQLGDGTVTARPSPVLVPTPTGAAVGTTWGPISTNTHTLALRSDNSLWAWGANFSGQLGDGTTTARLSAIAVATPMGAAPGTTWTKAEVGREHSLALRSDGTLWAWGDNRYGMLGDGTSTPKRTPALVPTPAGAAAGTTWTDMAAGYYFSLALRSDGTLWAWGENVYGELGTGSLSRSLVPVVVVTPTTAGAGTRWTRVVASENHTVALRSDGSLWAWGYNFHGQLGNNTTLSRSTPVREITNSTWSQIATCQSHTMAVRAGTGAVFATGSNFYGQLGNGNTTNSLVFLASAASVTATRPAAAPLAGVYPNPARAQCQLPALPAGSTVQLVDLRGRVVRQQAAALTLDLTGLASGLYLLTALAPGQAPRITRLVVE